MDHFSHARLPWFVCVGLLEKTGLGEDWELVVLMQNTFFSTVTLSPRSFALSPSNCEVAVSIANVQDPISLCSHALWCCCLSLASTRGWAASGQVCPWFLMYREKMMMLLLLLGSAEVWISFQAWKNWVMPRHLLVMYLFTVMQEPVQRWNRAHLLTLPPIPVI